MAPYLLPQTVRVCMLTPPQGLFCAHGSLQGHVQFILTTDGSGFDMSYEQAHKIISTLQSVRSRGFIVPTLCLEEWLLCVLALPTELFFFFFFAEGILANGSRHTQGKSNDK